MACSMSAACENHLRLQHRNSKLLWSAPTDTNLRAPTVSNGMLYVGSGNQFTAYGLPDGGTSMGSK